MTKLTVLKKTLVNIQKPGVFVGNRAESDRPHCVIGEINALEHDDFAYENYYDDEVFNYRERARLWGYLRLSTAIKVLKAAIRRLQRKGK